MEGSAASTASHGGTGLEASSPGPLHLNEAYGDAIQAALSETGDFGEVRLIVKKGRLRFIEIVRSWAFADPSRR